jgi:hypothetical protein
MQSTRLVLGIASALSLASCFFDFNRGVELEPGDTAGALFNAPNDERAPADFARIDVGSSHILRAGSDGRFVAKGLGEGAWSLRFDDDENGDGLLEWSAQRTVAITVRRHAEGVFGDGEPKATWVQLGDVDLLGVVELSGRVTREDTAEPVPGAKVYVVRGVDLPAFTDEGGTVRDLEVLGGVEATTTSDEEGRYRFPAIAVGDFSLLAFYASEDGSERLSAPPVDGSSTWRRKRARCKSSYRPRSTSA